MFVEYSVAILSMNSSDEVLVELAIFISDDMMMDNVIGSVIKWVMWRWLTYLDGGDRG